MREKINKLDFQKVFFAGTVMIMAVYSLLWLVQSLCVNYMRQTETSMSVMGNMVLVQGPKYSVPFPVDWCFVLEWFVPLFLCLSYAAVAAGQKRIHTILCTVTAAGFVAACFGTFGLKRYSLGDTSMSPLFSTNSIYWNGVDEQIGRFLPLYFIFWFFAALLLMFAASKILKQFGRSRKAKTVCLFLIFLFSLSEGILFNVVYFGQYTAFYIARSILMLLFVLFTVWRFGMQDTTQADAGQEQKTLETKDSHKSVKLFGIGIGVCILFYVFVGVADMFGEIRKQYAGQIFPVTVVVLQFLYHHFAVLLAAAGSIYTVKAKKGYAALGVLAVLCGAAFLVQGYLYGGGIRIVLGTTTTLTAWCIILFLLLIWLWKESQRIKMIFNVILYLIVIGGSYIERFVVKQQSHLHSTAFNIVSIIVCVIMLGITLYALCKTGTEYAEEETGIGRKGLFVWVLLFSYVVIATIDFEIILAVRNIWNIKPLARGALSVIGGVKKYMDIYGTNVMYVFAFLVIVSYLAHALKKKEMQLFCSLAAFAVMYYIEANHIYEIGTIQNWRIGLPISMLIMMALLFFFPFLTKLFPKKENILGGAFLLVTYAVLFLNYVLPLTTCDLLWYRWVWYVIAQIVLLGISGLTIVLYGKKGKE